MQVITVNQVNLWDGGDRHNFGFFLSSDVEAEKYKEIDPNCYITKKEIIIFDNIADYREYKSGEVKRRALSKLTVEERVALGFPAEVQV